MKKKNIIQFMPYFPPHIGGVEKVGEDLFLKWTHGKSIVFSGEIEKKKYVYNENKKSNIDNKGYFGYPCFDIVDNFPVPLIWTKRYRNAIRGVQKIIDSHSDEQFYIITHTRFFLSSLLGGKFAKKNKLKWIHIEHGSDYVKLSSKIKSKIAYFYDKSIGKYIFKKADKVLAISKAAENFIQRGFGQKKSQLWYRGINFPELKSLPELRNKFPNKKIIGYVGRLYKWKNVQGLIQAYYNIVESSKDKIQLIIVGEGEDLDRLKKLDIKNIIYFTGGVSQERAYSYQKEFDIHVHPSSPGGGLATTLMQAMNLGCLIVATPYEGADEVIEDEVNGFLLKDDSVGEIVKGIRKGLSSFGRKDTFAKYNQKLITTKFDLTQSIDDLYNLID